MGLNFPHVPAYSTPTTGRRTHSYDRSRVPLRLQNLALAMTQARDRVHGAELRLARVACARIAAAVGDLLTDDAPRPDAPFRYPVRPDCPP